MNKKKFTVNPVTGRSIQIGNRMWRKLVKQGVIDNDSYEKPNVLYTVKEDEYEKRFSDPSERSEEIKKEVYKQKERLIRQYSNPDASDYIPNKRPMVYKNKVVMGNNKLTTEEASKRTADAAIEVIDEIQNNEEQIPQNMTRKQAHEYLQGLIFDKMISNKKKFINSNLEPRRVKRSYSTVQKLKPLKRVPKKKIIEVEPANETEWEYVDEENNIVEEQYEEDY